MKAKENESVSYDRYWIDKFNNSINLLKNIYEQVFKKEEGK
jgi:hypothetical protein